MPTRTVVEAMARQQATLNVHSRYLHEGIVALAERIAALHGPAIESVVFSCSGTEANEVALRMARGATGKQRHRLHQRHLSRQQRGGRQDDPHRRRPEQRRRRARHPLPRDAAAARAGRKRSRPRGGLSRAPARRDPQPRGRRHGLRRPDRLPDLRQRGPARRAARLHGARGGDGAGGRRLPDRRRGPGGLLPHRALVGLRGHGLHARHRRHRQADGQRPAARRHRRQQGPGRRLPGADALFQHLRLEPAAGGGRHGGDRRHRARQTRGERRAASAPASRPPSANARRRAPPSATCAATGCSSAWRW